MQQYVPYGLAVVIGVVGLVSGIATGSGVLAGAGAGWLIAAIILIVLKQAAFIQVTRGGGQPGSSAAMFDLPPWLWLVAIALVVVGAVVGFSIHH